MAKTYRPVDRAQDFMLPPSMVDWLPEEHLVWFVIAAVERMDTTRFHARARLGGVGRRGYDPDMLLTLFVYAMAHGESSSRQIERLCGTDVAFRIICASDVPDHTVLARFRKRHEAALTGLLTESLVLAAELGMVSLGVVAFDGTKIAANASKDANRSEAHLRRLAEEFVSTVTATDEAEDALFGEQVRGDELPAGVRDRTGRGERITAALGQVQQRREAAERAERERAERARGYQQAAAEAAQRARLDRADRAHGYERAAAAGPRVGRPPAGTDRVAVAQARWQRARAEAQARYDALITSRGPQPRSGRQPVGPDEHSHVRRARAAYDDALAHAHATETATETATGDGVVPAGAGGTAEKTSEEKKRDRITANLTDPQSRLLKTRNGWVQGYNCQTVTSDDQFFVVARATQDANDVEQFVPTVDEVTATAEHLRNRTGRDDLDVGTMIGDAGFDSAANLDAEGPDRLIADAKRRTIDQRAATDPATGDPPTDATARARMNHRLRTEEGHALYKRRAPLVEAPNAWLKDGRGLRRFARRGLPAAQAELSLACAVTNVLRLLTKGITTARLNSRIAPARIAPAG